MGDDDSKSLVPYRFVHDVATNEEFGEHWAKPLCTVAGITVLAIWSVVITLVFMIPELMRLSLLFGW